MYFNTILPPSHWIILWAPLWLVLLYTYTLICRKLVFLNILLYYTQVDWLTHFYFSPFHFVQLNGCVAVYNVNVNCVHFVCTYKYPYRRRLHICIPTSCYLPVYMCCVCSKWFRRKETNYMYNIDRFEFHMVLYHPNE